MPADDSARTARDLLLNSWPGRLFIIAAALKVLVGLVRLVGDVPRFLAVASTAATIGLAFSVLFFLTRLIFLVQRRLLWRVRRKLILSHLHRRRPVAADPRVLSARHVVHGADGGGVLVPQRVRRHEPQRAAPGRGRRSRDWASPACHCRNHRSRATERSASLRYPTLSIAFIPATADGPEAVSRGPWEHLRDVSDGVVTVPDWVREERDGWTGTVTVVHPDAPNEPELVVRAVRAARRASGAIGWVVADVPLDDTMLARLQERTASRCRVLWQSRDRPTARHRPPDSGQSSAASGQLFGRTVSTFDTVNWPAKEPSRAMVGLSFRMSELYRRPHRCAVDGV